MVGLYKWTDKSIQTGERNIFLPEVIGVPSLSHWKVRAALREEGMLAMHVS